MEDLEIEFGVKFDISKESCDALIAAVGRGLPVASWMTAMGTGIKCVPSMCAPNEAWQELLKRSNENKKVCIVKNFVSEAMKNKILTVSTEGVTVTSGNRATEMISVGGFLVPEPIGKSAEMQAAVATEVAIESILFAQESDPNTRKSTITTVDVVKAAELDMPLFPIVAAYKNKHLKATVIEADLRIKEKRNPGIVVEFLKANMPTTVPSGRKNIKWLGYQFSPATPYRAPKVLNQNSLFQVISDHRKVRGADSGRRSLYSKGYYYGYMDSSLAKAFHLVADLEHLCSRTSGRRFLEIQNVDGLFTEIVLTSLIANGWVIRVVNGYGLSVLNCEDYDKKLQDGEVPKYPPGVYRSVIKCTAPFFVYHNLDEKTPTIVKNDVSKNYEVNLPSIVERLNEMKLDNDKDKGGRIAFTYVYYRDELKQVAQYLYASSHAHAAQLVFCSVESEERYHIDLESYMKRVLLANAYKTGFTYYRIPFYSKDPMRFSVSFNMTMKAKLVPTKNWTADDFSITIIEDKIQAHQIDYAGLRRRAPAIVKQMDIHDKKVPAEKRKRAMLFAVEKDNERIIEEQDQGTLQNLAPSLGAFSFGDDLSDLNNDLGRNDDVETGIIDDENDNDDGGGGDQENDN